MLSDPVEEAFGLIHRHPSGENFCRVIGIKERRFVPQAAPQRQNAVLPVVRFVARSVMVSSLVTQSTQYTQRSSITACKNPGLWNSDQGSSQDSVAATFRLTWDDIRVKGKML